MNGYDLSRRWFDWCFENPETIKPAHTALYFFIIEHSNRLGWPSKFALPTEMAKSAIGIHSYNTYIQTLNDLIKIGFIKMVQKSSNQYSSNIVAISNFDKALDKALDKAMIKHHTKQRESTIQSNDSINKPITYKPINPNSENKIENTNDQKINTAAEMLPAPGAPDQQIYYEQEIAMPYSMDMEMIGYIHAAWTADRKDQLFTLREAQTNFRGYCAKWKANNHGRPTREVMTVKGKTNKIVSSFLDG
jgi:hypothetical protein